MEAWKQGLIDQLDGLLDELHEALEVDFAYKGPDGELVRIPLPKGHEPGRSVIMAHLCSDDQVLAAMA